MTFASCAVDRGAAFIEWATPRPVRSRKKEFAMKCPTCPDASRSMTERQGVEIDYCPQCRGVWLDRGELDKLLERSVTTNQPAQAAPQRERYASPGHSGEARSHHGYDKRKKSWLYDIFD